MPLENSSSSHSAFFLAGIPSLEAAHSWLGILFCSMYIVAVLGNGALLLTIRLVPTLHHPMFYFLGMLGVIDLVMTTSLVPKMLSIFWMGAPKIDFADCFVQMFLIHSMTAMESGVLLAMAFDRYIAICCPLRYEAILTPQRVAQIALAILIRGIVFMAPLTWMVRRLPYCASKVIQHSYCEHMAVMKLACTDPTASRIYNLMGSTLIVGTDTAFITVSYGLILRAVMKLTQKTEQLKSFSTCSSHLCVLSLYYLPGMASIYIQCFPQGVPPPVQVLLANLYLILPPMLNPIIYSIQMKQVRDALQKVFPFLRELVGSPTGHFGWQGGPS
ncbi:olfactory receptor 52I1-like [Tiliqua scincoides]|uniref:olfactory receptor 52I1-like n=1 Tax=Tiliqua scincoides TaxID=71010 RepID=UPI003463739E